MFRTYHLVGAIALALLLASCGEDAEPPSGPRAEPATGPAVRVADTAVNRFRFQIRQTAASAFFYSFDPSGCVETFMFVFGAEEAVKEGPGKPTSGPFAFVQLSEYNSCTFDQREISGVTRDATFQAGQRLTGARLQATILGIDFLTQVEVPVVVDLTFTGTGEIGSQSQRLRIKVAGAMVSSSIKATFRPAEVSGTVTVGGENVAASVVEATISRRSEGFLELVRTR